MTVYEIPIQPVDMLFNVQLGNLTYHMRTRWDEAEEGGWILDISDGEDTPLIHGIPLVAGADLLEQYDTVNIGGGGHLYVYTDGQPFLPPTQENLGLNCHLLWEPDE